MPTPSTNNEAPALKSLNPNQILEVLDLTGPDLAEARAAADRGDREAALSALLPHYRAAHPLPEPSAGAGDRSFERADKVVDHILQWGPYKEAGYGSDVDWEWDPRGDIEWVAAVYRFYWAAPLVQAYKATGDGKYGHAFVELTRDWIAKHRLENHEHTHPVYTHWKGFVWLDLQTGIRATNICEAFRTLVHADAFTPEFLGILMASLYDHQVKTEALPMGVVHNKAIFEQRGFINVAHTFPEFQDSRRWMELALDRARHQFLAQTTSDGVQREWSFGYHTGVLRDAVEIVDRMDSVGIAVPDDFRDRIRAMYDYIFGVATPDLGAPMFGDGSRALLESDDRSRWPLYATLVEATELLGDPKYTARATLDRANLPEETSCAFSEAGMYVLRDDWGTDAIHFALHCSPKAISGHDQPDNGTFELYAYGRWLMPDTGFYTYGHDPDGRAWHRQTRVHQTLTLDGRDSADAGRQLLWRSSPELDTVVVENASYDGLTHRRTVWFVNRRFFVLLDEAIGNAKGALDLNFQLAPGEATLDSDGKWAKTGFGDADVLVWTGPGAAVALEEEEGWFAWAYGYRKPRKAFRYRHRDQAPAAFLTLVVPYRGSEMPDVSASLAKEFEVGGDGAIVSVEAFGQAWEVGRDFGRGEVWSGAR